MGMFSARHVKAPLLSESLAKLLLLREESKKNF